MHRFLLAAAVVALLATPVLADGTVEVGIGPFGIAVTPDGRTACTPLFGQYWPTWVDGNTAVFLDAATGQVLGSAETGLRPEDVVFTADGRTAFVVCSTSATVTAIDVATRTVLADIPIGTAWATFPYGACIVERPQGALLAVTTSGGNYDGSEENICLIDVATLRVVDSIEATGAFTRAEPLRNGFDFAVMRGGKDNNWRAIPELVVVDLPSGEFSKEIPIVPAPSGFHGIEDLAVDASGKIAFLATFYWEGGSDEVLVVDLEQQKVVDIIRLGSGDVAQHGIAMSPDGLLVPVTNFYAGTVSWIFTPTHTVVRETPVGAGPNEIAFTPDGRRAFVTNQLSGSVNWIDLEASDALVKRLVAEGSATPAAARDLARSVEKLEDAVASGNDARARAALANLVKRVRLHAQAGAYSIGIAKDPVPPAAGENGVPTPIAPGGVEVFDAAAATLSK